MTEAHELPPVSWHELADAIVAWDSCDGLMVGAMLRGGRLAPSSINDQLLTSLGRAARTSEERLSQLAQRILEWRAAETRRREQRLTEKPA